MRIINVIEIVDNNVQGITSYPIHEEQLSQDVVDEAEADFKTKAIENGCIAEDEDEWDEIIGDGYWSSDPFKSAAGNYTVNLVWSYVD